MKNTNVINQIKHVRETSKALAISSNASRIHALDVIAKALEENKEYIFKENEKDLALAKEAGISDAIYHRLIFSEDKLESVISGLNSLASLPDPLNKVREKRELDEGFILEKRSFPIGVIGMIFEARPDALVQIAGLAVRSGNGVILKGGKEARNSNKALVTVIKDATRNIDITDGWILQLESHDDVDALLKAEGDVDLLIPRGSNKFVRYVMDNTHIPVMGHADGICSTFVDESADLSLAANVCQDAKVQYPAACNATETFLIHRAIAGKFLPMLKSKFDEYNVVIHGDPEVCKYIDAIPATDSDWDTEYLNLECAVKVVADVEEAIEHVSMHGSKHTDAIITNNEVNRDRYFAEVDSADVFCNCSTRFADGFRFGLGAEVGISTSKLHARGPVGLEGLTTTKWLLLGNGERVADYSGRNARSFKHKELM